MSKNKKKVENKDLVEFMVPPLPMDKSTSIIQLPKIKAEVRIASNREMDYTLDMANQLWTNDLNTDRRRRSIYEPRG
jgi:hypothetical protein